MLLFRFLAYMKKVVDSGFATWCGGDGDDRRLPQRFRSQSSSFPGSLGFPARACLQEHFVFRSALSSGAVFFRRFKLSFC
ncbi:hypothetical protein MtrunA17_Chr6g0449021 [Medicago truncatula]|uniref:Uncharacterized protein n=1 Tax=Medicago truncatula TaxID=3880 RepID=A0A396HCZ7_MEDTR|nr:hypothetical protein MtrunA17_Chr6g0449021 [Medicago truncatula]